jgi:hypothetical protein
MGHWLSLKVDARDHLRPLNYRGRFLEGVSAKIKEKEFLWRNAPLWKDGRTDLAQQMCTKDMISIESVLEDANAQPMATPESEEFGFSGARKIEQIGQNACEKLLQGMMKDLNMTSRSGVFIIDLNVSVGNMFEAFASLRSSFNLPTFYIGCTDETETAEWFEIHKQVSWI